jgi:hypothetical protein
MVFFSCKILLEMNYFSSSDWNYTSCLNIILFNNSLIVGNFNQVSKHKCDFFLKTTFGRATIKPIFKKTI